MQLDCNNADTNATKLHETRETFFLNPPAPKEPLRVPPEIQARLEKAGLRRTLATRAVLGLFLSRPGGGLTHAQALACLNARGLVINRVTLYRLLDRLAGCGVLQRKADEARTWHFSLAQPMPDRAEESAQPRFECDTCHRQFRLTDASESTRAVASTLFSALARMGHRGERVDMSIHGVCSGCSEPG